VDRGSREDGRGRSTMENGGLTLARGCSGGLNLVGPKKNQAIFQRNNFSI
jgi:hypothetical protein